MSNLVKLETSHRNSDPCPNGECSLANEMTMLDVIEHAITFLPPLNIR